MTEPASGKPYGVVAPLQPFQVQALALGVLISLLAALASVLPVTWNWQETVDLELLFRARGTRPAPDDVVLVPIDGRAARRLFLPSAPQDFERCTDVQLDAPRAGYRNPDPPELLTRWPRCLHARALDALAAAEPEVVVMDISFRPRNDPAGVFAEQDQTLAAAMRRSGRVVLPLKIKSHEKTDQRAQPIESDIEGAALAVVPFLLIGDQLQRTDKFCTFKEDGGWFGPCLPAVAYQIAALGIYADLRALLADAAVKNVDLIPVRAEALLSDGAVQAPVGLIRHLAISEERTGERLRALLQSGKPARGADAPKLRGMAEVYLGPAVRYFNFYGRPGAFRTLRYEALVAGDKSARLEAGSLRGKVVFIGFAEYERPELTEHFTTLFTSTENIKLSGVELAATAYANLQDGSAIVPTSSWTRALIALSIGLACTVLSIVFSPAAAIPLCLGVMAAYFAGALVLFDRYAAWLPLLIPLGFAPAAVAGGLAARYTKLRRERDRSEDERRRLKQERDQLEVERDHRTQVIAEMLSPRLKERIIRNQLRLADLQESTEGACLSTDLEDFTPWSETRQPHEVARFINDYFSVLDPVLDQHEADSSDISGDGMMAIWADRLRDRSVRTRVCAAALKLAEAAEHFRRIQPEADLKTRIGVDYGTLQMGMIGGFSHRGYRATGDVPNTATRVQEFNRDLQTQVLVSSEVIAGLSEFMVRDVGRFLLRRKQTPVHLYQLVGLRGNVTLEQLRLCEVFAKALTAYQAGRKAEAARLFGKLRTVDGPSRYYAVLCATGQYYRDAPIVAEQTKASSAQALR